MENKAWYSLRRILWISPNDCSSSGSSYTVLNRWFEKFSWCTSSHSLKNESPFLLNSIHDILSWVLRAFEKLYKASFASSCSLPIPRRVFHFNLVHIPGTHILTFVFIRVRMDKVKVQCQHLEKTIPLLMIVLYYHWHRRKIDMIIPTHVTAIVILSARQKCHRFMRFFSKSSFDEFLFDRILFRINLPSLYIGDGKMVDL